ncbi:MAG: MotA/TolQ/ExbB proton channel family protein [Labilithrix sp.]|nr:MotA/TolQ/ExbB proton channel family protein [Labilithrix sp.]MBX3222685.1 MotA/TolQ/ExbB proton channel family protein [Labilithrix sp.]
MSFSPLHIWASMGLPSKVIASFLLLMAVMSLAVVVERHVTLLRSASATRRFLGAVIPHLSGRNYESALKVASELRLSPFARVARPVLVKITGEREGKLTVVELAQREAERQKEAVGLELRRGMGVLASVGSIAPFVGLLGTVVGIISAFQGIATTGSGGLGAVSAGIAEALVETALGLCVAIPAVLFFNQLNTKINGIEAELGRRTGELLDELENNHGYRDSGKIEVAA